MRPSFEDFVPSTASRRAIAAARAFAVGAPESARLLFLYGGTGVGKTHLLYAIGRAASDRAAKPVAYITAADLTQTLVDSVRRDSLEALDRHYRRLDLLMLDDLHVLASKPATQATLACLVAGWLDTGVRVVCGAGCPLNRLSDFALQLPPPPTVQFIEMPRPGIRATREIIVGMTKKSGMFLEQHTLDKLAAWCVGDTRRAVGALRQLQFERSVRSPGPNA